MFTFLGTHQEGEICKSHGTLPELKAFIDSKANNDMKCILENGKEGKTGHYLKLVLMSFYHSLLLHPWR